MMELSSVFKQSNFLLKLMNASEDDRIIILQNITSGQLACIGEIARRICHHIFPLLTQDLTFLGQRLSVTVNIFGKDT